MRLFKPLLTTIVPLAALAALAGPAYADVTLRLAIWDANQKPAIEEIMARFTEQNPGINVSLEVVPRADYVSKLETSIVAKTRRTCSGTRCLIASSICRATGSSRI
jgi:ABC-type glycerol-3-phosphate transport system substrate-binding protein